MARDFRYDINEILLHLFHYMYNWSVCLQRINFIDFKNVSDSDF